MSLVVFTGTTGIIISTKPNNLLLEIITIICIALGSGSAAVINMWYDRDIDKIMYRTCNRPLPTGKVSAKSALLFGIVLALFSVAIMCIAVNPLSALLLTVAILFYAVVYTIWLKRSTAQNIVIGGIAGALPPMIGYTAVTGTIDMYSIVLFLIIFMWTPPHFWALSLFCSDDYVRAKIPMLPITHGVRVAKLYILVYSVSLVIITLIPSLLGLSHVLYNLSLIPLDGLFLWYAVKLYMSKEKLTYAYKLFYFSIIYLFALFLIVSIDKIYFA